MTPAHCLSALQRMANAAGASPLTPEQLPKAVRLVHSLHQLQAQGQSFHGQVRPRSSAVTPHCMGLLTSILFISCVPARLTVMFGHPI